MTTDLNTLLTALYVKIDDWLGTRTRAGRPPKLTDAELITLAVAEVLLGVRSEARWLRFVPRALPHAFTYLPGQSGHNKRLRSAVSLIKRVIHALAADTDLWTDPVGVVDSTPVECARSHPTTKRSNLQALSAAAPRRCRPTTPTPACQDQSREESLSLRATERTRSANTKLRQRLHDLYRSRNVPAAHTQEHSWRHVVKIGSQKSAIRTGRALAVGAAGMAAALLFGAVPANASVGSMSVRLFTFNEKTCGSGSSRVIGSGFVQMTDPEIGQVLLADSQWRVRIEGWGEDTFEDDREFGPHFLSYVNGEILPESGGFRFNYNRCVRNSDLNEDSPGEDDIYLNAYLVRPDGKTVRTARSDTLHGTT